MIKYSNDINNAQRLLGLCTLLFFCFLSCSNVNKGIVDLKKQYISAEEIQIELDLIKDSIGEFINSNKENVIFPDFNITLKTLEKPYFKLEKGEWKIGRWFIEKVGTQEYIARYYGSSGLDSLTMEVFLSKQGDGTYKAIDWTGEIYQMEDYGSGPE
jgi:hypothetical protein